MLTIGLPIMLIAKIDFKKELKPWAVMLPITFAWAGYIVAQVYAWIQIGTFHKRLRHLDQSSLTKQHPLLKIPLRGLNTVHCSLVPVSTMINRFVMFVMPLITFLYLGVLLKVYVLKSVTWVQISPVSLAPFVLCYGYELSCEFFKNALNFKRKRPHLHAMLAETKDADSKERKHSATTLKVNLGLLPNFLLIATYNYGFFLLLCLIL